MKRTPRSMKLAALLAAGAIVAVACGDDSGKSDTTTTTAAAATTTTVAAATTTAAEATTTVGEATTTTAGEATTTTAAGEVTTTAPAATTAMTLTIDLNPDAVWEDGSPITYEDLECTWQANLNTPGSIATTGYDQITSVEAGTSEKQAVVSFSALSAYNMSV